MDAMQAEPTDVVDLTASTQATTALLLAPLQWRVRAVEAIEIESADRCRRRRSLQCAPLRELLAPVVNLGQAVNAFVVLNVATVPRGPLFDFDVEGPDGAPAFLLPRNEIAERQVDYLKALAAEAGVLVPAGAALMAVAALAFSPSAWFHDDEVQEDLPGYFSDGLRTEVTEEQCLEWAAVSADCRDLLGPYLSTDDPNVFDDVSLALPAMRINGEPPSPAVCATALTDFASVLRDAVAVEAPSTPAREFLESLVDYGHSYDLLVAVEVPLDRPFMLKYAESRSVSLDWWKREAHQDAVIADAITNHVFVRVSDPNVQLSSLEARKPDVSAADAFGDMSLSGAADTRGFYAHGDDRDYRVRLWLRLAPLPRLEAVNYAAALLVAFVVILLLLERPQGRDLALLAGPTALAATVLLSREPTTIGSRLRVVSTALLVTAVVAMAVVAVSLYLG